MPLAVTTHTIGLAGSLKQNPQKKGVRKGGSFPFKDIQK